MRLFRKSAYVGLAPSRTSPSPLTPWLVSIRIMEQGLGPGFTIVATRRSVIFKSEGREFALTFFGYNFMASRVSNDVPKMPAEDFRTSRRSINWRLSFLMKPSYPREHFRM